MTASTPSPATKYGGQLLLAADAELAYRCVSSGADEMTVVVDGDSPAHDFGGEKYDAVVLAGFSETPERLRAIVDQAFALVTESGEVRIEASVRPVEVDLAVWDRHFADLEIDFGDGAFEGARLTRAGTDRVGAGALLYALLVGLSTGRQVELRSAPPLVEEELPLVPDLVLGRSKKARPKVVSSTPLQLAGRRLWLVGGVPAVLACGVAVGLYALSGGYAISVLVVGVAVLVSALALRIERHQRRLEARLAQVEAISVSQRDEQRKLASSLRPVNLNRRVLQILRDLRHMQPGIAVDQLEAAESRRAVQRIEESVRKSDSRS